VNPNPNAKTNTTTTTNASGQVHVSPPSSPRDRLTQGSQRYSLNTASTSADTASSESQAHASFRSFESFGVGKDSQSPRDSRDGRSLRSVAGKERQRDDGRPQGIASSEIITALAQVQSMLFGVCFIFCFFVCVCVCVVFVFVFFGLFDLLFGCVVILFSSYCPIYS
jgi:hypothetical protein